MVVPYYSFQNIKVDGKELKNAISQSFARKLGIDEKEKNFKISIDVYVPVNNILINVKLMILKHWVLYHRFLLRK